MTGAKRWWRPRSLRQLHLGFGDRQPGGAASAPSVWSACDEMAAPLTARSPIRSPHSSHSYRTSAVGLEGIRLAAGPGSFAVSRPAQ